MARAIFVLAIASCPLLADVEHDLDRALLAPAHNCTFAQKDRIGPIQLQASFLIWQSKEWGLEFASKSYLPSTPGSSLETFKQKLYVPDFSWSPGCKVDFGYDLSYDSWNFDSRWTFYKGDCTNLKKHFDSQIAPAGLGIVPLWHYPFFDVSSDQNPIRFQNAAGNWKLFFNSFDAGFGRMFTPTCSLIFRMHMGAKGSWIRQYYHVEYHNSAPISAIIDPSSGSETVQYQVSRMAYSSDAWGIGPRGGLETKWKLGWGFSLVAEGAFSYLTSYWNTTTDFHDRLVSSDSYNMHLTKHQWELMPVFEGTIGFDWGHCFGCQHKPTYLGLTIAYEMQYWWSQNHAPRNFAFQAPGNMWDMRGDLQMQGLTASVHWDF